MNKMKKLTVAQEEQQRMAVRTQWIGLWILIVCGVLYFLVLA